MPARRRRSGGAAESLRISWFVAAKLHKSRIPIYLDRYPSVVSVFATLMLGVAGAPPSRRPSFTETAYLFI